MYHTILYGGIFAVSALLLYYMTSQKGHDIVQIINYISLYGYIIHIMKLLRKINDYRFRQNIFGKILFVFANFSIFTTICYFTYYHTYQYLNKIPTEDPDDLELFGIIFASMFLSQYLLHILFPINKCSSVGNNMPDMNNTIDIRSYKKFLTGQLIFTCVISYNLWTPFMIQINDFYIILYQVLIILLVIFLLVGLLTRQIISFQHVYVWSATILLYILTIGYSVLFLFYHNKSYVLVQVNLILLVGNLIVMTYMWCIEPIRRPENDNQVLFIPIIQEPENPDLIRNLINQYASPAEPGSDDYPQV
jgi:hypothetical protein